MLNRRLPCSSWCKASKQSLRRIDLVPEAAAALEARSLSNALFPLLGGGKPLFVSGSRGLASGGRSSEVPLTELGILDPIVSVTLVFAMSYHFKYFASPE